MTFKEKLQKEHPEYVGDNFEGGCSGCPYDYDYEKTPKQLCRSMGNCEECWNREMPESEKAKTYDQGLQDAWKMAKKIFSGVEKGGYSAEQLDEIFGFLYLAQILWEYTPQEALAKIEAYEQDNIKFGDVVHHTSSDEDAIVICKCNDEEYKLLFGDYDVVRCEASQFTRTGKHIDIQKILDGIGKE